MSSGVLFDLARDCSPWSGPLFGLGSLVVGALSVWLLKKSPLGKQRPWMAWLLSAPWAMPLVVTLVLLPGLLSDMHAVRDGRAAVVEGAVHDLRRWTEHRGQAKICFDVVDVHMTGVPYGPMRDALHDGMHVRVHYVDDKADATVVRLEVLR